MGKLKVNVTYEFHGLRQKEFFAGGVSVSPDDGELRLTDEDSNIEESFPHDAWIAFAVENLNVVVP